MEGWRDPKLEEIQCARHREREEENDRRDARTLQGRPWFQKRSQAATAVQCIHFGLIAWSDLNIRAAYTMDASAD